VNCDRIQIHTFIVSAVSGRMEQDAAKTHPGEAIKSLQTSDTRGEEMHATATQLLGEKFKSKDILSRSLLMPFKIVINMPIYRL
jgi:hypothetical protein